MGDLNGPFLESALEPSRVKLKMTNTAAATAANGDKQSTMEQIKSTTIAYINYPAWSDADKQKLKQRLLFYIPFYIFIAGLDFLWIWAFHASTLANTDGKRPLLHGRGIQSPGINYEPRLMNSNSQHNAYIKDVHKEIDDQVAFSYKSGGGKIYYEAMQAWLDDQGYDLSDYGDFGDCNKENFFGFSIDKPCLFIKINKVIDWEPKGIEAGDIDEFFKSDDSNLMSSEGYCSESRFGEWCTKTRVAKKKDAMRKQIFGDANAEYDMPFVSCMVVNGPGDLPINYEPSNGRMEYANGFFTGNSAAQTRTGESIFAGRNSNPAGRSSSKFKTPLVAVQFDFTDDKHKGKDIQIHCFVFDRNMEIETDDQASGMLDLYINVNK